MEALYPITSLLQVIHSEEVIHNDLKPENFVCIGPDLRLIDFGIANKIELDHTSIERDICCGTVNYMAPEAIDTHEDKEYYKVHGLALNMLGVSSFAHFESPMEISQLLKRHS